MRPFDRALRKIKILNWGPDSKDPTVKAHKGPPHLHQQRERERDREQPTQLLTESLLVFKTYELKVKLWGYSDYSIPKRLQVAYSTTQKSENCSSIAASLKNLVLCGGSRRLGARVLPMS